MRGIVASLLVLSSASVFAQTRIRDVIYLKQGGCAYTMDVFTPAKSNHKAVVWMVSGGWVSDHANISPELGKAFTDKGFTVFQVVHGAQPKYTIPEIVSTVRRAVRFIRANAATYDISPNAIGVCGASSGGHLSLEIGGLGDDGDPKSKDPVEQTSCRVNAVVAFMPPTDFLNWGATGVTPFKVKDMQVFMPAFGVTENTPIATVMKVGHDDSPIILVKPGFPPTLIVHGAKDALVPVQQAHLIDDAFAKAGVDHKLVIIPGAGHYLGTMVAGFQATLDWFDGHLKP